MRMRSQSTYYIHFLYIYHIGGLAQSVECDVRNVEAEGSKPSFSTFVEMNNDDTHVCSKWLNIQLGD